MNVVRLEARDLDGVHEALYGPRRRAIHVEGEQHLAFRPVSEVDRDSVPVVVHVGGDALIWRELAVEKALGSAHAHRVRVETRTLVVVARPTRQHDGTPAEPLGRNVL